VRKRGVVQAFWPDGKVLRLSDGQALFFIGTWCVADDKGRLRYDVREIAACLCRWTAHQVEKMLIELVEIGVLEAYGEDVEGHPAFLHVVNFNKHQYINHPQGSKLPAAPSEQPGLYEGNGKVLPLGEGVKSA
jgi:hypothetical protein